MFMSKNGCPANILLLQSAAASEGAWIDVSCLESFSAQAVGFASGDSVELLGSNSPVAPPVAPPQPGDGSSQIYGLPITADTFMGSSSISQPCHWVRARKTTTATAPSLTVVYLQGINGIVP
jgi:hypothetical protein